MRKTRTPEPQRGQQRGQQTKHNATASSPAKGGAAPETKPSPWLDGRTWGAAWAASAPGLLAYNAAPSPTFLNQALALAGWAVFVLLCPPSSPGVNPWAAWLALLGLATGVLWSWGPGALPSGIALCALGLLAAAALLLAGGAGASRHDAASSPKQALAPSFVAFACGLAIAGVLNAGVALIQVFAPGWSEGTLVAISGLPGRAIGNLRQPNHLSSIFLWACIALVALQAMGRVGWRWGLAGMALFVWGDVLTASRTGLVSVLLLAAWGLADNKLPTPARRLLYLAPLLYAIAWLGMDQWAKLATQTFGGAQRLAEGDISSSRFGIWANTLQLIAQQPWAGVGFGEFNLAWSLTAFPGRPNALFDHTHNLFLQLWVELGVPLGSLVLGLLMWALWCAARQAFARRSEQGLVDPAKQGSAAMVLSEADVAARAAVAVVLMIGLHSQLEYPLWYAYFLLPTAWALGYALADAPLPQWLQSLVPPAWHNKPSEAGAPGTTASLAPSGATTITMTALPLLLCLGAAYSVWDYSRVVRIYQGAINDAPLLDRVQSGRSSAFFAPLADYAAATSELDDLPPQDLRAALHSATHNLLDARLMMAWADWLASQGHEDLARHLAARLREFRKTEAAKYFAICPKPRAVGVPDAANTPSASSVASAPHQCLAPARAVNWREFLVVPARTP